MGTWRSIVTIKLVGCHMVASLIGPWGLTPGDLSLGMDGRSMSQ